jgi:uncharacterized protein YbjT (DUF2867 family)
MTVLITGGTGVLGRLVVPLLRAAAPAVRVLSRQPHPSSDGVEYLVGDLETGDGVDKAVAGVQTIVHCAGTQLGDDQKARVLVRAARAAGSPHLVFISVVGADRIPVVSRFDRMAFGYFASKWAAEQVVEASGLPWTTLRATQFHDLVLLASRAMAKLPVIPMPSSTRFQPIDAGDVAERLVELVLGNPAGRVPDVAGPRIYNAADLVRGYLRAAGRRRLIVPVALPGRAAAAIRAGANLAPDHAAGTRTWEEFLVERLRS